MARLISLILLLLVACCPPKQPPASTLRIVFSQFPSTLDPQKSGDFISSTLLCLLYEGLMRCAPDGSAEPGIAESVEISADQKRYTFHLRDAVWSDGTAVTAWDFERSWKQAVNPASPSLCAYLFYSIRGAESVVNRELPVDQLGVVARDARTLEVALERPTPHFLALTAFPSFLPKPLQSGNVTNGPFYIQQISPYARIFLCKNGKFWNAGKIHLDAIDIHVIPEETTALKMFEQGELDWIGGGLSPLPADAFEELKAMGHLSFYSIAASTFCTFNTQEFPFQNEHMRKAFSLAINRHEIVSHLLHSSQGEATTVVPPALWKERPAQLASLFNAELARWHFQKGCEELGIQELDPITLSVRTSDNDRLLSLILQKQWKEVLGVKVKVQRTDTKSLKTLLHRRDYQMALSNWIAQYPDPMNILERFLSPTHSKNYPAWEDAEFARLVREARETSDLGVRRELLLAAEKRLTESAVIAPIYHWKTPSLCSARVRNIATNPSGGILFERARLEN